MRVALLRKARSLSAPCVSIAFTQKLLSVLAGLRKACDSWLIALEDAAKTQGTRRTGFVTLIQTYLLYLHVLSQLCFLTLLKNIADHKNGGDGLLWCWKEGMMTEKELFLNVWLCVYLRRQKFGDGGWPKIMFESLNI